MPTTRPSRKSSPTYSPEDFLNIWQDMCGIREFETILNEIKTKGAYKGITYNHAGPAHLSIGQEAAAVGMAFSLAPDDHIFGSHRSHGEILAKGFSAIRQLSDDATAGHHADVPRRRPAASGRKGLQRHRAGPGAALLHLRRVQRDLRARDGLQSRAGRIHARLLRAVRHLSQQRDRGRLGFHRARARRCSSASTASPASWWPTSATPRSAAARCGKASPSPPWTSTASCGTSRWAAACRSCSTA